MFIDASAIVAILTRETEADALADRLDGATGCITSPIAMSEAALAICRKRQASVTAARVDVGEFLDIARIGVVAITPADGDAALDAFDRYGRGGVTLRSSTWRTASPTRWRKTGACLCCSRATTSTRRI
jgi:ribonuclease VapC